MKPSRALIPIVSIVALLSMQSAPAQSDNLPVLPPPAPMPAIPEPLPRETVEMGDPDKLPEVKMDFPMAAGPFEPTWESISARYPAEPPAWLREAKFGFWVHFGPQAAGMSGDWYAKRLYQPGQAAYANHQKNYGHPSEFGYKDVLHAWNPNKLDPATYVKLFHDAGARFLFIQGVHHDNFPFKMLNVQRGVDVNARIQYLLHILIAFGVARTRRVRVSEFIHQHNGGFSRQHCIHIHFRQGRAAIFNLLAR